MKLKKKQKGDDWFDDCVVCRAMKFAEKEGRAPTLKELQQAFVLSITFTYILDNFSLLRVG